MAKLKIEHQNEKKLREILEKRGLTKKKKNNKTPVIKNNYRMPKGKNNE